MTIDIHVLEVDVSEPSLAIEGHEPQAQTGILESLDEDELPDGTDRTAEVVADHSPAPA